MAVNMQEENVINDGLQECKGGTLFQVKALGLSKNSDISLEET